MVEADLEVVGTDRLAGTITNVSDRPLEEAALFFGGQVYDQLGTIAPGATVQVNVTSRMRPLSGYLEERARRFVTEQGNYLSRDRARRLPRTARGRHRPGGDVPRAAWPTRPRPHPPRPSGAWTSPASSRWTGRCWWPGSTARWPNSILTGAPSAPQIDQTSLLRVILPLGRPDDGETSTDAAKPDDETAADDAIIMIGD